MLVFLPTEGDGPNNQHNFVNRARKKLIIKLIDYILVFYNTPTPNSIVPKTMVSPFPRSPPPVESPRLLSLLRRVRVLLVGCCVLSLIFGRLSPRRIFFSHQFLSINSTAKAMTRRPPARSSPVVSPLRCTPNH